jgi:hypothetical protein
MKKKTKRYSGEDGISDVEDMKTKANEGKGIFSGAAAAEDEYAPKKRSFTTVSPARPRPRVAKPKASQDSAFPISVSTMESGADVMRRGRAGESDSGSNPSLERMKSGREADAARKKRKMDFAMERVKAGVGYKSGGSVGSASKRADGIAQKGKTKGRMV